MKKVIFMLVLASLFFSGCAMKFTQVGKSEADVSRDYGKCHYEASLATPHGDAIQKSIRIRSLIRSCMDNKGYVEGGR